MKSLYVLLLMLPVIGMKAQNFIVETKGPGTQVYNLESLRKITFSTDSMQVHLLSGQTEYWAKSDIRNMYFKENALGNNPTSQSYGHQFKLYPSPNSGEFQIEWMNYHNGQGQVSIYDLQGKLVHSQEIELSSMGKQKMLISIPGQISNGTYIIRLNKGSEIWHSKLMIQK